MHRMSPKAEARRRVLRTVGVLPVVPLLAGCPALLSDDFHITEADVHVDHEAPGAATNPDGAIADATMAPGDAAAAAGDAVSAADTGLAGDDTTCAALSCPTCGQGFACCTPSGACGCSRVVSGSCSTSPPEASTEDVVGCGATNSTLNCGACGQACDTATGAPSCDGVTCSYACNAGRSDCDFSRPNTDGCECATPGCCPGAACQTTHSTGVGLNYYDCNARGTGQSQAMAACGAFMTANGGSASACSQSQSGNCGCFGMCGPSANSICAKDSSGACYCWQYSGPNGGTVQNPGGSCIASCGSRNDPSWN